MNLFLRIIVGIVTTCFVATAANYYFQFGWYGTHARLVSTIMMLVTIVAINISIRLWREPRQGLGGSTADAHDRQ